jgi:hypothetical protein
MKIIIRILAITLVLGALTLHVPIRAELLVMKQTDTGIAPLDENNDDMDETAIQKVLMACQWPMDISNERKIIPREEVLKPNNARIEERVAEQAIANYSLFEKGDPLAPTFRLVRVVFFPTCLYELFAIHEAYTTQNTDNPLQKAIKKTYEQQPGLWSQYSEGRIYLDPIIGGKGNPQEIRTKINDIYMKVNKIFIGQSDSAYMYINHKLATWLLTEYPDLKQSKNSAALSEAIHLKIEEIKTKLIERLTSLSQIKLIFQEYESRDSDARQYGYGYQLINGLKRESTNKLLSNFIALEYEARELNKGILVRGTSFEEFQQLQDDSNKKMIAGSTVLQEQFRRNFETGETTNKPFEQAYKEKETRPYSVSFGNSLFAGSLRDRTACAYTFLQGERIYSNTSESTFKTVGYALLINKKDYVEHQNSQLFFIPPISPLASLFLKGEYFHARSKAAIAVKPQKSIRVQGLFNDIDDPTGVILITRDPLKHAELFSEFLAENGRIIQTGDPSQLTEEEKQFAQNVLKTQQQAAGYYKGIKGAKPMWETVLPRARKNIAERNGAETTTQE